MCEYSCDTPRGKLCNATMALCPNERDDCATRLETLINQWCAGERDMTEETAQFIRNYLSNDTISVGELNDMPIEER